MKRIKRERGKSSNVLSEIKMLKMNAIGKKLKKENRRKRRSWRGLGKRGRSRRERIWKKRPDARKRWRTNKTKDLKKN